MRNRVGIWYLVPGAVAGCLVLLSGVAVTVIIVAGAVWAIKEVF